MGRVGGEEIIAGPLIACYLVLTRKFGRGRVGKWCVGRMIMMLDLPTDGHHICMGRVYGANTESRERWRGKGSIHDSKQVGDRLSCCGKK